MPLPRTSQFTKTTSIKDIDLSSVLIIIPCYNEALNIEKTIQNLLEIANFHFIIIDDCSTDGTTKIVQKNNWNCIRNETNLKLEGAFHVGIRYALDHNYKYAIQYDGDGQHNPATILEMVYYADKGYDVLITSRYHYVDNKISNNKKIAHCILRWLFYMKTFQKISDPTCGLRLYNWVAMQIFAKNHKLKPEPASIAYLVCKEKLKIKEIGTYVFERSNGKSFFDSRKNIFFYMTSQIWKTIFLTRKKK